MKNEEKSDARDEALLQPCEPVSEAEKWQQFFTGMAVERKYIAIEVANQRRRERTRKLINCAAVLWVILALSAFVYTAAEKQRQRGVSHLFGVKINSPYR